MLTSDWSLYVLLLMKLVLHPSGYMFDIVALVKKMDMGSIGCDYKCEYFHLDKTKNNVPDFCNEKNVLVFCKFACRFFIDHFDTRSNIFYEMHLSVFFCPRWSWCTSFFSPILLTRTINLWDRWARDVSICSEVRHTPLCRGPPLISNWPPPHRLVMFKDIILPCFHSLWIGTECRTWQFHTSNGLLK